VRLEAIEALGAIGADAAAAEPDLRAILAEGRYDLRMAAFTALDSIRPEGWDANKELLALFAASDARVRAFAVEQLGARKVEEAVPHLLASLNDMSHLVRRAAVAALRATAPENEDFRLLLEAAREGRMILSPAEAE
jgi:HEAT repeat protein